jgi:uncharacterized protein
MNLQIEPCIPPLWARGGHLQTLMAYGLPSLKPTQNYKAVLIPLPDGDQLTGRFYQGTSSTLILLFHGLIGSVDSSYMGRMAQLCLKENHSVLLMNHRGCGEGVQLARGPYHSGRGDDISEVVKFCRKTWPQKQLLAMGFSMSANALLSLLTGQRGEHLPDQAIAVNGPSDLQAASESLKVGLNRLYDLWFVDGCRREIQLKRKHQLLLESVPLSRWHHLHDVDELYTAPRGGFKNAQDYYTQCSTAPHLSKISIPTFILMSKDDPFIPWEPYLSAQTNSNVHLHLEKTGGHMGYLSQTSSPWGYKRWMDETLMKVIREMTH